MSDKLVYFIKPVGMNGPIKIGCSRLPEQRLESLTIWSPFPLEIAAAIPGSFRLEINIHDCFADDILHHEWFRATPRLLALIAALNRGIPIERAIDLNDRRGDTRAAHYALRSANRRANRERSKAKPSQEAAA